jgi:uncharacterized protein
VSAYTYPGVYIEELPSGVHTITGVATSIAAFAGWAPQGPIDEAVLVQSWLDYQNQFGGLDLRSLLGYAVNQFFGNGGQQAYIVRIAQTAEITTGSGTTPINGKVTVPATGGSLDFAATSPGVWSNSYGIQIALGSSPTTFDILVVYAPAGAPLAVVETFPGLVASASPTITSKFVTLAITGPPTANPAPGFFAISGGVDGDGVGVLAAVAASTTIDQPSSTSLGFTFTASSPGAWGNLVAISATPQSAAMDPTGTRFSLNVITASAGGVMQVVESYNNLSVVASDPRYVVTVLNTDSNYVSVAAAGVATQALNQAQPTALSPPAATPLTGAFLSGGNDGIVLDPTLDSSGGLFETALNVAGTAVSGNVYGIHLLDRVPIFNLLCVPGESDPQAISGLQAYCAGSNIRAFYIVDCAGTATFSSLEAGPPSAIAGQYSSNSAFYFPWVSAPDPLAGSRPRPFPPCGFVAGIYAATDASRGVWKAPAGIDASLSGIQGLEYNLTDLENGTLNTQAINCLRQFRVYGNVVWGARTLQGNDQAGSQWKYIPIRRFALFLETSLYDGTQWAVFEPNDSTLWGQLRLNIGSFMQGLFLQGAFQGTTPAQAYFVKCDSENNPQTTIDQGIVNVTVGFAPLYPAEFVVIQIQQMAGQTQS